MREKAPGSGGPAAGRPDGVKSGEKLFQEVKDGIQAASGEAPASASISPAEMDIRETKSDGSADPESTIHVESREEADQVVAQEMEKISDMTDEPESQDFTASATPEPEPEPKPRAKRRT